jgi:hypothetical protein
MPEPQRPPEDELASLRAEVRRLEGELAEAHKEVKHWKANHDHQVRSKQRGHEIQADIIAALRDELDTLRGG